jgi:hypothetical protein
MIRKLACFVFGALALVCLVAAVLAALRQDMDGVAAGMGGALAYGVIALLVLPRPGFMEWLAANHKAIEYKTARYRDVPVTAETMLVRYEMVVSLIHFTFVQQSDYEVLGSPWAKATRIAFSLATLLLGWWAIPGIPASATVLERNRTNANTTPLRELLPPPKARPAMVGDALGH